MKFASDLLYTLKLLKKNAGFSLLCVLLIGLGMVTSLALFSLTWNLRLKTPDFPSVERFVTLSAPAPTIPADAINRFSPQFFEFARDNAQSFSLLGGARLRVRFNINDGGTSRVASTATISPALLQATGVQPLLGRSLLPQDDRPEAEPAALLSYELWQSFYAGDPEVVGRRSRIGGTPRTIVGVMPPGFGFPLNSELWLPLQLELADTAGLTLLGVLREGIPLTAANAEVMDISRTFSAGLQGGEDLPLLAFARPFNHLMSISGAILVVLPALTAAIVLLVAFNLGNLLHYRANERAHELAVRSAVGGTRFRVMQVLLLESLLLCAFGCALGLLLSAGALHYLDGALRVAFAGESLPFWMNFSLDRPMIAFTLACTLLIWLFSGVVPALRLLSRDLNGLLAAGSRGLSKKGSLRLTRAFVNLEVMVSCFLLIISSAFVVVSALDVRTEFGVTSEGRYAGEVLIDGAGSPAMGDIQAMARELRQEQLATAGVIDATYSTGTPSSGAPVLRYNLEDRDLADEDGAYPPLYVFGVADNYFEVLGVDIIEGRAFNPDEGTAVTIIDERLAERLWPAEPRIGKRIRLDPENDGPWLTVVGVTETFHQEYNPVAGRPVLLSIFRPFAQTDPSMFHSVIESGLPPAEAFELLGDTAARTSPEIAVHRVETLYDKMMVNSRPFLMLRDIFIALTALVAVLIGSVIFGLISRSYLNRADEIGLRRALGASDRQALMPFARETAVTLGLGLGVGGLGGVLLSSALGAMFPNIGLYLPATAAGAMLFTALIVMAASWVPAARAVAMEPGDALRYE